MGTRLGSVEGTGVVGIIVGTGVGEKVSTLTELTSTVVMPPRRR